MAKLWPVLIRQYGKRREGICGDCWQYGICGEGCFLWDFRIVLWAIRIVQRGEVENQYGEYWEKMI